MERMDGRENMFDHTFGLDPMSPEMYGTGEVQSGHPSAMIWAIWRTMPQFILGRYNSSETASFELVHNCLNTARSAVDSSWAEQ